MVTEGVSPEGWSHDEAVLVLSLLVEDPRRRGVSPPQLLELGEFLGRSPSSISFKAAGYRALEDGESPRTRRVSSVQREVYREYGARTAELLKKSEALRAALLRGLPSARIEGSPEGFPGEQPLEGVAEALSFPWSACHPYLHGRGQVRGLAISSAEILARAGAAQGFFKHLTKNLGPVARTSAGFRRVERGDFDGFTEGVLKWKFPTLHLEEVKGPGAALSRQLMVRPEIHRLFVTADDARPVSQDETRSAQDRIRHVLGLEPRFLCASCTLLVGYVAHQVERKVKASEQW